MSFFNFFNYSTYAAASTTTVADDAVTRPITTTTTVAVDDSVIRPEVTITPDTGDDNVIRPEVTITPDTGDDPVTIGEPSAPIAFTKFVWCGTHYYNACINGVTIDANNCYNNKIHTKNGNNIITVGHGNDKVEAGCGNDIVTTFGGDDVIELNGGNDCLTLNIAESGPLSGWCKDNYFYSDCGKDTFEFIALQKFLDCPKFKCEAAAYEAKIAKCPGAGFYFDTFNTYVSGFESFNLKAAIPPTPW